MYCKINWILFSIATTASLWSNLHLWVLMENSSKSLFLLKQVLDTVLVIIETFVVALPVRLLHFVYPLCYGIWYVIWERIFASISYLRPNAIINDETTSGDAARWHFMSLLFLIPCHFIFFVVYTLKLYLYEKFRLLVKFQGQKREMQIPKVEIINAT